ncbi:MAG: RNA methyltransferase [Sphingomonadales bacterium]|jgi:tRNA/rRNA methyltransferase
MINDQPVIILVRPQLGENIGKSARAMFNFGLTEMRIVSPRDGWPNPDAGPSAAGADRVLDAVQVFESVDDAVSDLSLVYASTVRGRDIVKSVETPNEAIAIMKEGVGRGIKVGILFGPERSGLSNEDLQQVDKIFTVPVNPDFGSLNLAQAIIIFAYEWYKFGNPPHPEEDVKLDPPAVKEELQSFFTHLEGELDKRGYFHPKDRTPKMLQSLRDLWQNANLNSQQVRTLRGVIKYLTKTYGGN